MISRMSILPWKNSWSVIVLSLVVFTTGFLFHFAFNSSRTTNLLTSCKNCGFNSDLDPLQENTVPNIVYYIWCDRKIFDFKHYLSVKSVFRFVNPDRVVIYLAHRPRIDKYNYNQWYLELIKEENDVLIEDKICAPASFTKFCIWEECKKHASYE